ncbi:MAG: DUF485 domain-containing protein [Polyangiales bacterium]
MSNPPDRPTDNDAAHHAEVEAIGGRRMRLAAVLTLATMATYFGFILLVAFDKPLLGRQLAPGLSVGIALGAVVIVVAWLLTGIYVRWANKHYDAAIHRLRGDA